MREKDGLMDLDYKFGIELVELNSGMRFKELIEMLVELSNDTGEFLLITDAKYGDAVYFTDRTEAEVAKAVIEILNDE